MIGRPRMPGRDVIKPALIGLAVAVVFGWVLYVVDDIRADRDTAETATAQAEPVIAELLAICEAGRPEQLPPGLTCAEVRDTQEAIDDAEVQDPEVDDPELQDPEIQDSEEQDPERQDPEQQERERQDPESDDPDPDDPESQDPEGDDPEQQDAEFDDPENQEPEEQDPEIDDPEPNDPDPDDPDPNDPDPDDPGQYPESWTFEWMGVTYVCTDPDGDHHYTCEEQP